MTVVAAVSFISQNRANEERVRGMNNTKTVGLLRNGGRLSVALKRRSARRGGS